MTTVRMESKSRLSETKVSILTKSLEQHEERCFLPSCTRVSRLRIAGSHSRAPHRASGLGLGLHPSDLHRKDRKSQ
jgi:hypothetical protein